MIVEVGQVLLSEPFLQDPNFERTVVLIVQESEAGSVGFVLNQKLDITSNELITQFDFPEMPIYQGGPVGLDTLNLIHFTDKPFEGSIPLCKNIYWGGDMEKIREGLHDGSIHQEHIKLFQGYSGWAPGQLYEEIENDDWIVADANTSDIFNPTLLGNQLWKKIISTLGDDYKLMVNYPTDPSLN